MSWGIIEFIKAMALVSQSKSKTPFKEPWDERRTVPYRSKIIPQPPYGIVAYSAGYKYQTKTDYYSATPIKPPREILTTFVCLGKNGHMLIRRHYAWNGASGPTVDSLSSIRASLEHDALYQLMQEGELNRAFKGEVDKYFKSLLIQDGMSSVRASLWDAGLALFGHHATTEDAIAPVCYAPYNLAMKLGIISKTKETNSFPEDSTGD